MDHVVPTSPVAPLLGQMPQAELINHFAAHSALEGLQKRTSGPTHPAPPAAVLHGGLPPSWILQRIQCSFHSEPRPPRLQQRDKENDRHHNRHKESTLKLTFVAWKGRLHR